MQIHAVLIPQPQNARDFFLRLIRDPTYLIFQQNTPTFIQYTLELKSRTQAFYLRYSDTPTAGKPSNHVMMIYF